MTHPPLLFLDTETLGVDPAAPIWEIAAVRLSPNNIEQKYETFVLHDPEDWVETLPASFQDDYESRYRADEAVLPVEAIDRISRMARDGAIVCGSKPSFDMEGLERLAAKNGVVQAFPWHHHPMDVPTLAHGWLLGKGIRPAPPWKSDFLSQACGVDPRAFGRHTAMGDVKWCRSLWHRVMAS